MHREFFSLRLSCPRGVVYRTYVLHSSEAPKLRVGGGEWRPIADDTPRGLGCVRGSVPVANSWFLGFYWGSMEINARAFQLVSPYEVEVFAVIPLLRFRHIGEREVC